MPAWFPADIPVAIFCHTTFRHEEISQMLPIMPDVFDHTTGRVYHIPASSIFPWGKNLADYQGGEGGGVFPRGLTACFEDKNPVGILLRPPALMFEVIGLSLRGSYDGRYRQDYQKLQPSHSLQPAALT